MVPLGDPDKGGAAPPFRCKIKCLVCNLLIVAALAYSADIWGGGDVNLATCDHRALPVTAIAFLDDPDLIRIRPGPAATQIARRDDFKL